jgi:NAD(P)-dependent dehydrogenase (short-subunit alcohol dehydrogenase family)
MKVLLTGASGGIGNSILVDLLDAGHEVVATFYTANESKLLQDPKVHWVKVDFANSAAVKNFLVPLNDIDVVIHCAGIADSNLLGNQSSEKILEVIVTNLVSSIIIANHYTHKMISQGFGRIILMGSIVGRDGNIGLSAYAASKSGIQGLVDSATREIPVLKKKLNSDANFTINYIAPGFTVTNMTANIPLKIKDVLNSRSSINRFVEPSEIARLVEFLIHKDSEAICGACMEINGGSFL